MRPPTADEVRAYWTEANLHGDPAEFWDHFEERDWKPKGYTTRMKSWQAAARNWSRNEVKWGHSGQVQKRPESSEESEREAEAQRLAAAEIAEIERMRRESFS